MKLTHNLRYDFTNWHGAPAHCWLRVFEDKDRIPIAIVTEMPDNEGVSVTNYAEELATEVQRKYGFSQLRWIEHYPPRGRKLHSNEEFDLVEFKQDADGVYNEPEWCPISKNDVEAMIGTSLDEMRDGVPIWVSDFQQFLQKRSPDGMNACEVGAMIHEALALVDAAKYADDKTRFSFTFEGISEPEIVIIRAHLSPEENRIVEIKSR